jgi:hypothetical protein
MNIVAINNNSVLKKDYILRKRFFHMWSKAELGRYGKMATIIYDILIYLL